MIKWQGLLVLLCLAGAVARADEDDPKTLYERATAAYALQNYEEAARLYEHSFSVKPDPALLYNAAQAHRMGGNKVRALKLYQNYLKLYGSRIPNRGEVERHIVQLKAAIKSDEAAASAPPTEPRAVTPETPADAHREAATAPPAPEPTTTTTNANGNANANGNVTSTALTTTAAPVDQPPKKKAWIWGVVVGAVVVVGVGLGLGLGLGLQQSPRNPSPTAGAFSAN